MKETLICTLSKHHIYYLSDNNCSFYISVPFKDYNETNISVRLKSNYQTYDLNKNTLDIVTNEVINYYKKIDDYNITLILPVFYDDTLTRIRTVNDMIIYQKIDSYLGKMFNFAYQILSKNGIKVNSNIFIINNNSFTRFTNWFVSKYNNRVEYKTILELVNQTNGFSSYDVVETPNINFVVGKNEIPTLDKTVEMEVETFDNFAKNITAGENNKLVKRESYGFVSYILLGVITFVISFVLLFVLVK